MLPSKSGFLRFRQAMIESCLIRDTEELIKCIEQTLSKHLQQRHQLPRYIYENNHLFKNHDR